MNIDGFPKEMFLDLHLCNSLALFLPKGKSLHLPILFFHNFGAFPPFEFFWTWTDPLALWLKILELEMPCQTFSKQPNGQNSYEIEFPPKITRNLIYYLVSRRREGKWWGREGEMGTLIFFGEFLGFTPKNTYVYFYVRLKSTPKTTLSGNSKQKTT